MDFVALVPAYEPDDGLADYVDRLRGEGFRHVVVVDDGSGERYGAIFGALGNKPFCSVLRHAENRGKGAALKTGFAFIQREFPDAAGVVTADSDGQHDPADCRRLAEGVAANGGGMMLGCRTFSLGTVPFRSWIGNRWASATFGLIHGCWLPDTQTGLRAFPMSLLPFLLKVDGDRFEYEMEMLIAASRSGIRIGTVPIRTIYVNGNAGTHFHPLLDTLRINSRVFAGFFRFAGVSLMSFALDQGLAWAFASGLSAVGLGRTNAIWLSGFAARFLSAVFNFSLNRTYVFRSGGGVASSAWRYALLCVAVIVLSNAGVTGLVALGMSRGVAKLICDVILYFLGYRVQSRLIFAD